MSNHRGQRLAVSPGRALVGDITHFARRVPLFPVEKTIDLSEVAVRRAAARPRISWTLLFLKAYALVARRQPELRRAYQSWPWPHFIEWPHSVAMLAVSRDEPAGPRLFWARFDRPEDQPLRKLQGRLRSYLQSPPEEAFKQQTQLSRLPTALRRLIWWWNLEFAGAQRAKRLGTFSLSSLGGHGVLNRSHPTLLTSSLTFGPLDANQRAVVTLLCDHRVLDGVAAAAALNELERVLQSEICSELHSLQRAKAA